MDIYEPRLLMEAYSEVYQNQEVDTELYEQVVEFLINEGYAEDQDDADALIEELSDEDIDGILDEANRGEQRLGGRGLEPILVRSKRMASFAGRPLNLRSEDELMHKHPDYVAGHRKGGQPNLASGHTERIQTHKKNRGVKKPKGLVTASMRGPNPNVSNYYAVKGVNEELDTYDLVLDYLLDEGYANSEDAALQIMAHMSEEWKDEIVEGFKPTNYTVNQFNRYGSGRSRTATRIDNQIEKLKKSGKNAQAMNVDFINRIQDDPEGRNEVMEISRRNRSKLDARARRDAQRDSQ